MRGRRRIEPPCWRFASQMRPTTPRLGFFSIRSVVRPSPIEANVVEGYALGTTPQFRRHLSIARGSAAEAECLSRLASEMGYLSESRGRELENSFGDALRPITGLLR